MGVLEVNAGRCLMVGFEGTSLDAGARDALIEIAPGGLILFTRNLETPERLGSLLAEVARLLEPPTLIAIDQEGGRVSRLAPWLGPTPSAAALARSGAGAVRRFGHATGEVLRALGFSVDLAPVVDLTDPDSPHGIGDRSFGTDPEMVALFAGAFLDGLQGAGVAGCLKHFPGLGHARADTHLALPRIERSLEELESEELVPFARLAPRAAMIMVSHGHYAALDPGREVPATTSEAAVRGLLRRRIGFPGLVLSDDMEMGAIRGLVAGAADSVAAMRAGCDLLLYCKNLERAARSRDALVAAARSDEGFATRLEEAARAVTLTAARWPATATDELAWTRARDGLLEASRLA